MKIVFFPYKFLSELKKSFSVFESKALVGSSRTKNSGSLYKALAIPILCIWPPDNLDPLSPIIVFKPSGRLSINLSN